MKATIERKIWVATKNHQEPIDVVQYDSGRTISIEIMDMEIPSGAVATINGLKPDETTIFNSCTISGQVLTADFTTNALAAVGKLYLQFQILSSNDIVTTFELVVVIRKTIVDAEAIESTNEFGALTDALQTVSGLQDEIDEVNTGLSTLEDELGKVAEEARDLALNNYDVTYGTHRTATVSLQTNVPSPIVGINGVAESELSLYDYRDDVVDYDCYTADNSIESSGFQFDISNVSANSVTSASSLPNDYIKEGMIVQLYTGDPSADLSGSYYGVVDGDLATDNIISVNCWYLMGSEDAVLPAGVQKGVLNIKTKSYIGNSVFRATADCPDYHNYGVVHQADVYVDKEDFNQVTSFESVLRRSINTPMVGFSARNESELQDRGTALYSKGMANIIRNDKEAIMTQSGALGTPYVVPAAVRPAPIILTNGVNINLNTLGFVASGSFTLYNNSNVSVTVTALCVFYSTGFNNFSLGARGSITMFYDINTSNFYIMSDSYSKHISGANGESSCFTIDEDLDLSTFGKFIPNEYKFIYNIGASAIAITNNGGTMVSKAGSTTSVTLESRSVAFALLTNAGVFHIINL